jgi:hypothetical protein
MQPMEDKIAAIYELREAAERHARIEAEVGTKPTGVDRDRLLDARIELEQKTQQAVESCVHCGRLHADERTSCDSDSPDERGDVINVDFSRRERNGGSDRAGPGGA